MTKKSFSIKTLDARLTVNNKDQLRNRLRALNIFTAYEIEQYEDACEDSYLPLIKTVEDVVNDMYALEIINAR